MRQENVPVKAKYKHIPTELTKEQAAEFVLPYLSTPKRGPACRVPLSRIFNYILKFLVSLRGSTKDPLFHLTMKEIF